MHPWYRIIGTRRIPAKALGLHGHGNGLRPADAVDQHGEDRLHRERARLQAARRKGRAHLGVLPRHPRHQVERRQDAIGKLGREVALVQQAGNEEVPLGGKCKQDAQPGVGQQTGGQLQRRVQVLRHGRAHTVRHGRKAAQIHGLRAAAPGVVKAHHKQAERRNAGRQQDDADLFQTYPGAEHQQQQADGQHQQVQADQILKREQNDTDQHRKCLYGGVPAFQHLQHLLCGFFHQRGIFQPVDLIGPGRSQLGIVGDEDDRQPLLLHFFPQVSDMDCHRVFIPERIVIPHLLIDLIRGKYLPRVLHEKF